MKRNFYLLGAKFISFAFGVLTLSSCLSDGEDTIVLEDGKTNVAGIPSDDDATPNPLIDGNTTSIPNIQYATEIDGDDVIIRLDMTGVYETDTYNWLRLLGTNHGKKQNIWVSVDGKPKGIDVYNTADDNTGETKVKADLVFLVDNSGSMSEEADAIARDILSWSEKLSASSLDIQYGCVGYGGNVGTEHSYLVDGYGVTGAIDITDYTNLNNFLNARGVTKTDRTKGYAGANSSYLSKQALDFYYRAGGECGVQALRFADENFNFRKGANRIYVNFTDDANYPGGDRNISIDFVTKTGKWTTDKGTIHSVISNDTVTIKRRGECPWRMSQYTGGTILTTSSSFSGVTLEDIPITGAMQNSYIIRFTNVEEFMDGKPHEVKITILSPDGKTRAERTFYIIFGNKR